jgi:hypothetical protein
VSAFTEVLLGWRGGDECVICDGVLYYLVYSTGVLVNSNEHRQVGEEHTDGEPLPESREPIGSQIRSVGAGNRFEPRFVR